MSEPADDFVPENLRGVRAHIPDRNKRNGDPMLKLLLWVGVALVGVLVGMILNFTNSPQLELFGSAILILVGFFFYFIPAFVASVRLHHNAMAISVLNLLLGWTVIGWSVALVWACTQSAISRK